MSVAVRLLDQRSAWKPGEELEVEVTWSQEEAAEELEVRLLWETRGRPDREEGVIDKDQVKGVGSSGERRIEFRLPDGPWSYDGHVVEIAWLVDAVVWPSGENAQAEFALSPTGGPVRPLMSPEEDPDFVEAKKRHPALFNWLEKQAAKRAKE